MLWSSIFICLSTAYLFFANNQNQVSGQSNGGRLDVLHSWPYVDFLYPSDAARNAAVQMSTYIPENVVILDSDQYIDRSGNRRVFVSMPRFRDGIPATVGEVTDVRRQNTVLIRPFPNWESQSSAECEGPTSVYRIHIDSCNRLWVLDTGRIDTFMNPRRVCQPKLLIYDLANNDNRIQRYELPDGVVTQTSNVASLITDIRSGSNGCQNTFAYIADVNAFGLVVYDFANRNSWRIDHNYFHPFPAHGTIKVKDVTFDLMDGVFGLGLGPIINGERFLYFHSLASLNEGSVQTSVLRDYPTIVNNWSADRIRSSFKLSGDAKPGQSTLQVVTEDGIAIFAVLAKYALYCWNTKLPYTSNNLHLIYQNDETLQFISGMKLLGDALLVTSSRLQNYIDGKRDTTTVKYRILSGSASNLLSGSPCRQNSSTSSGGRGNGRVNRHIDNHGANNNKNIIGYNRYKSHYD